MKRFNDLKNFLREHLNPNSDTVQARLTLADIDTPAATEELNRQLEEELAFLDPTRDTRCLKEKPSRQRFEYKIIYEEDMSDFQQVICKELNAGWQLAGSVFVLRDYYCQPLMRVTEEANDE